ncbi:cytochrome P450 [Aspergillus recurvatus]
MGIITALTTLLSPDPSQTAATFFVLGAASHQCIRHGEIDNRLRPLSAFYLSTFVGLYVCYIRIFPLSWPRALGGTILAASSFNLGLFISIIIYRAFLHRLRHFPGSWMAKMTRISTALRTVERTQYHLDLREMHRKYGDFVRTGPREISINRPSAVHPVSGPQSPCTKPTWYSHVSDDITKVSLNSTRDPDVHRRRRRAWDRGFSMKALPTYEPRHQRKVNVLISQIRSRLDQPLNIAQWTMYLAFDVMGLVGFSKDFRQLEDAAEHAAIKELHGQMLILGILKPVPWVLTIIGAIQGLVGNYGQFMTYCADRIAEKKANKVPQDVISWLFKAVDEKDQSAPLGAQALNEDGRLLIITGSDTTGVALANAFYYLAKHPAVYRKLQAELDSAFPCGNQSNGINNESLRNLPYLEAIDEVWVPGDTIIVVPQYVVQRDDRYFPSGDEFIPERWLDEKRTLIRHEEAFFSFLLGRYGCVGKQLALMEMRLVIARIALEFDLAFAPGDTGEAFDRGAKDTFTFTVGPLMLDIQPRSA